MLNFVAKPVRSAVAGFWSGFWAPLRALGLILTSPHLLSLVAVPLAVNIGLYILFFRYGAAYFDGQITALMAHLTSSVPAWIVSLSGWILRVLSWLLLALVSMLTFTFVSGLVAAPFNDLLSKAALRRHLKGRDEALSLVHIKHGFKAVILLECKRMAVLLCGAVVALIIGIIPFLQLVALALGAFLVSFEYFGYPISHRSASLGPVFAFTLRHPAVSLGFGSFLLLLMALPFASLVYIPLAVVGGTMLHADHHHHDAKRT